MPSPEPSTDAPQGNGSGMLANAGEPMAAADPAATSVVPQGSVSAQESVAPPGAVAAQASVAPPGVVAAPGAVAAPGSVALSGSVVTMPGTVAVARPSRARRLHLPRSRRGLAALLLVLAGIGAALTFGASAAIGWTETADFCGRCHQMGPELAAYNAGAHREVACAECHVEPGVGGWIKAKLNGTKQLIQVVTGLYPKPVPPPDHSNLPAVKDTCIRCHSTDRLATTTMVTGTAFAEDEGNTREFIGLMVRPNGGDAIDVNRSVHWHVLQDVEFVAADINNQKIQYVKVTRPGGQVETFLAQDQIRNGDDVGPDIARVLAANPVHRMDCLECHNRVGHPIPNPRKGIDGDMAAGRLDSSLPYLKREAMSLLTADYPTVDAADSAIASLRTYYELHYPAVAKASASSVGAAVTELQRLYRLVATPDMKVSAKTYPDNLGHTDFPGCFRCHDGGHYLIKNGAATKEVIPATCDTCHTFPQLGPDVASIPFGKPPTTHTDRLWVFDHRSVATSVDPGGQTCGQCHAKDYCLNCHQTGAITVKHDEMLLNHAAVIRTSGNAACAYCHQKPYCARCHSEDVLPANGIGGIDPEGLGGTGALDSDAWRAGVLLGAQPSGWWPLRAPT